MKSCVTVGPIHYWQMFDHVLKLSRLPLRLSPLSERYFNDNCLQLWYQLQEVLSGLEEKAKTLDINMDFCGIHSLFFFPLGVFCCCCCCCCCCCFVLFLFLQQQQLSSIAVLFNLTGHAARVWPLIETSHCSSHAHYSDSTQQILQKP